MGPLEETFRAMGAPKKWQNNGVPTIWDHFFNVQRFLFADGCFRRGVSIFGCLSFPNQAIDSEPLREASVWETGGEKGWELWSFLEGWFFLLLMEEIMYKTL